MIMSESTKEIAKALSAAQAMISNVSKTKAANGYKYAELYECLEMIRLPLSTNELSLTQFPSIENGETIFVSLLIHSSGEWIKSIIPLQPAHNYTKDGRKTLNDMQALGSAITYLRRYALCAMLGLAQEDDDGRSAQPMPEYKPNYTSPAAKPANPPKQDKPAPVHEDVVRLMEMLKDHNVDAKIFTKMHNISSSDLASVKNALANFDKFLDLYHDENPIDDAL